MLVVCATRITSGTFESLLGRKKGGAVQTFVCTLALLVVSRALSYLLGHLHMRRTPCFSPHILRQKNCTPNAVGAQTDVLFHIAVWICSSCICITYRTAQRLTASSMLSNVPHITHVAFMGKILVSIVHLAELGLRPPAIY